MHTLDQLLFAQHFPFTGAARKIVKAENLSLGELQPELFERANLMVRHALEGKKYAPELKISDLLLQEVLAFPVAKIVLSVAAQPQMYARLASMVANSTLEFLDLAKDKKKEAIALASDLGISFDFSENKAFFVSLPLQEFLQIPFKDDSLKLVNQFVSKGQVFLDLNGFCRFLKEKAYLIVLSSLPVKLEGIPAKLKKIALGVKGEAKAREQKLFKAAFRGKLAPEAFPPCIAQMYGQLASGQKIPHMANFTLATFLNSVGMPKVQMLALFRKSPNFKERVAGYQLDRIVKQNYAPPGCDKIKAYGYCTADCRVKHPLGFYRRQMRQKGTSKSQAGEEGPEGKEGKTEKGADSK
jgi:DNA primase large subunit